MQNPAIEPLSRLYRTHPGRGTGHDDIEVCQHQKLMEFPENHFGRVKHRTNIAFLAQLVVYRELYAKLRQVLGRRDEFAEER